MKDFLKNVLAYILISLVFTTLILYIYDGNFQEWPIIWQGTLLFTLIIALLERIMMLLYVKYRLPSFIRVQLIIVIGLLLYTLVVWVTRPWLLDKIYNFPIFLVTIFPMFIIGALVFEFYFRKKSKIYNNQLNLLKLKALNKAKKTK